MPPALLVLPKNLDKKYTCPIDQCPPWDYLSPCAAAPDESSRKLLALRCNGAHRHIRCTNTLDPVPEAAGRRDAMTESIHPR